MEASAEAARGPQNDRIRVADLAGPANCKSTLNSHPTPPYRRTKPHAAFHVNMSEPPHQLPIDWNDWLNVDLLDACYDPMHNGMGLDR
jgi:hypothetical protein